MFLILIHPIDVEVQGETSSNILDSIGKEKTKRTISSKRLKATPAPTKKIVKSKSSTPASMQARNALNCHFYNKETEIRMRIFDSESIAVEKIVNQ